MTDELEVLEPSGSSVKYQGASVEVRPLTVGQLPRFVREVKPILGQLQALAPLIDESADGEQMLAGVLDLIEEHGERLQRAVAIATGLTDAVVAKGGIDEFVALAKKVIEVNADFFARKLVPQLVAARAAQASGSGPTRSSS